jgi:hypothetical protein
LQDPKVCKVNKGSFGKKYQCYWIAKGL